MLNPKRVLRKNKNRNSRQTQKLHYQPRGLLRSAFCLFRKFLKQKLTSKEKSRNVFCFFHFIFIHCTFGLLLSYNKKMHCNWNLIVYYLYHLAGWTDNCWLFQGNLGSNLVKWGQMFWPFPSDWELQKVLQNLPAGNINTD